MGKGGWERQGWEEGWEQLCRSSGAPKQGRVPAGDSGGMEPSTKPEVSWQCPWLKEGHGQKPAPGCHLNPISSTSQGCLILPTPQR